MTQTPQPAPDPGDGQLGRKAARAIRKARRRNRPPWGERHGKLLYWAPAVLMSLVWLVLAIGNTITGHGGWLYVFLAATFSVTTATYGLAKYGEFKRGWRQGYMAGQLDTLEIVTRKRTGDEPVPSAAMTRMFATGDPSPEPWETGHLRPAPVEPRSQTE